MKPLLERIVEDALEDEYRDRTSPTTRWTSALPALLAITGVGLVLAAGVTTARQGAAAVEGQRLELAAIVETRLERVTMLQADIATLEAEIAALTEAAIEREGSGSSLVSRATTVGVAAGTTAVAGPGFRVVIDDAPADGSGVTPEGGRVLDVDVQQVVNGLWEAGAEAVAVSGQRLTATSAIRSANDVVLVNYEPVFPPYEVRAIGDPRRLPTAFAASDGGRWVQSLASLYGVQVTLDPVDRDDPPLELTGGPVSVRTATPVSDEEAS
jgi:uncharacterized protein YlxW (UPF0749 family)